MPLVSQAPVRQAPPEHSWNKPLKGEDSLGTYRERGEATTSSGLCELTEKTDSEPHGPGAGPSTGTAVAACATGALPARGLGSHVLAWPGTCRRVKSFRTHSRRHESLKTPAGLPLGPPVTQGACPPHPLPLFP